MAGKQVAQLVKMANQIALNFGAWGDDALVAQKTGEHLQKFWTPAMHQQLLEHWRAGGQDLSPAVSLVMADMAQQTAAPGPAGDVH